LGVNERANCGLEMFEVKAVGKFLQWADGTFGFGPAEVFAKPNQ